LKQRELPEDVGDFHRFVLEVEPRLRRALISTYGRERGRDAAAEALAWAFEHRDKLPAIDNPVAYLYRVGQSKSRLRRQVTVFERPVVEEPWVEPQLARALAALPSKQRSAIVLVHGAGLTHSEAAALLHARTATVQKRVERALRQLRAQIVGGAHGQG
jgi:DNA-directed RNA polymerase specialized sigma24 family protein